MDSNDLVTIFCGVLLILAGYLGLPTMVVIAKTVLPPNKITSISIHLLFTRINYAIADPLQVQNYLGSVEIPHLPIFATIACLAITAQIR